LNNAFFIGNVAIIRLLLRAGADLDYQNCRSWSSVSYLWDPDRPSHCSTSEILEICEEQGFSGWNDTDVRGWSAVHRAAAYGCGDDIRKLAYNGVNMRTYTTDHLWGPVTCAVWNSNQSTFDAYVDLLLEEEMVQARDSRGWSLLHFAAQKGSGRLMMKLMELGVAVDALTKPTNHWVTERLESKPLKAETIAREYGHGEAWDNAIESLRT
jgi:ankyrin repeat protein